MNSTINDKQAFIRHIIDNPEDDVSRLIFCDWLEDNDQTERAQGIRKQIEHRSILQCWGDWTVGQQCNIDSGNIMCDPCTWLYHYCNYPGKMLGESETGNDRYQLHRGFVFEVKCRVHEWFEYGDEIGQQQPILKVTIKDKEAYKVDGSDRWGWERARRKTDLYAIDEQQWVLPQWLFDLLDWNMIRPFASYSQVRYADRYKSLQAAMEDLSRACIKWSRRNL